MIARRNGCHNRATFKTRVPVQDGWFMDGATRAPKMIAIPFAMRQDCAYTHTTLGQTDPGCHECKHRHTSKEQQ